MKDSHSLVASDACLADSIDALLPQTQCTKCGYQGCRPYAEAIAAGDAINKCPPGGKAGIEKLAALLNVPILPLDTSHGEELPQTLVAFIREPECIGCTKCIQACPVDAIIGAAKLMHTVVADICTGCDLCVAACPVDCIDMLPEPMSAFSTMTDEQIAKQHKADLSRQRFVMHKERLDRIAREKERRRYVRKESLLASNTTSSATAVNEAINAALAAVRVKTAIQLPEEQLLRLERATVSARERFDHASKKVMQAQSAGSSQLDALLARREDMRFRLDEAERKLAALLATMPDASSRMIALRAQKTDFERLNDSLVLIENKLQEAFFQLDSANGCAKVLLEANIAVLQNKQAAVLDKLKQSCENTDRP